MGIRRLGRPTGFNFPVGLSVASSNTVVDYLVVAGGGAAGQAGGGGGAGGFTQGVNQTVSLSTNYSIKVGAGATGASSPSVNGQGSDGSWSFINTTHSSINAKSIVGNCFANS